MRIPHFILPILALACFPAMMAHAEMIEFRANATVRACTDDQGITRRCAEVGDAVVVLLTYDNSVANSSTGPETGHYDFTSRLGAFSITVGDHTWKHDFAIDDLKARVFNDYETPSPPHDRFDVSGRGVLEDTFPFAQSGLNYFNLQLIDKDGSMLESPRLPDDQTEIVVADLKFANGVVQARDTDSKIIWSFQYYVDDIKITRVIEPETSLLLSIATLILIAVAFCAIFLLVVAGVAHLIPKQPEQEDSSSIGPHDSKLK